MKIYALICHKLVLTQLWPKVVSWRFEKTTDVLPVSTLKDSTWVFCTSYTHVCFDFEKPASPQLLNDEEINGPSG